LEAALKRGVEEFFQQDHSSDHRCQDDTSDKSDSSKEGRGDAVSCVLTDTLPSTYDEMTMPDFSSEHRVAIANDDLSLIGPALRGPVEDTIKELLAEAAADPIDALDADAVDSSKGVITKIRQTQRTKITTMAATILDRVSEELLSDETCLTDSQLANLMISSFNHMFPSDSSFPGQEPMPGTTVCRFCGKDLLQRTTDVPIMLFSVRRRP
jgi:hypothetical protein